MDSESLLWCSKQPTFEPDHYFSLVCLFTFILSSILLISSAVWTAELLTKISYLPSNLSSLLNCLASIGWRVQVICTDVCNFIHLSFSLLLMFRLFTLPRCMEECVESRDWCVKHLSWILMRESVSVDTLFLNARNCFLRLRVDPSPYLRVSFGCWLLEMFRMKPRYDVVYCGVDWALLLVMGSSFWQGCSWLQRMVLCSINDWEKKISDTSSK